MSIAFAAARSLILEHVAPLGIERVWLLDAASRVLAEAALAPWDMPRWDNSAMDGYAVRAADCPGSAVLTVSGYLPAGASAEGIAVLPGMAVKIMTGAPIPEGCDAVVPVEETEADGGRVHIQAQVEPGAHFRRRGEDVAGGEMVIPAGTLLRPPEINMLASFGQAFIGGPPPTKGRHPLHRRRTGGTGRTDRSGPHRQQQLPFAGGGGEGNWR